jgi:xanthosine utilization system XapX-like protein
MKVVLMLIPQMVVPMAVFALVKAFLGLSFAVASLGLLGLIGFLLRERIFDQIVKIYQSQKYSTIEAFKKG